MIQDVLSKRITRKSPMHMVLIVDDSGSMEGDPALQATNAIHAWVNELHVACRGTMPYFRFSLVSFGSNTHIIAENVNILEVDITGFILAGKSGTTQMATALNTARELLQRDNATASFCPPFVFLFTDGRPTNERGDPTYEASQDTIQAASLLKALPRPCGSPFLITLGYGNVDDVYMRQLASAPNLYHRIPNMAALVKLLPMIGTPVVEGGGTVGSFIEQISGGIRER